MTEVKMCSPGVGCVEKELSLCAAGCKSRRDDNIKGKKTGDWRGGFKNKRKREAGGGEKE